MKKFVLMALLGLIPAQAHAQQRLATLPRLQLPALTSRAAILGGSLIVLGGVVVKVMYNARTQSRILPQNHRPPQSSTIPITSDCLKKAMAALESNSKNLCQQSSGLDAQINAEEARIVEWQKYKKMLEIQKQVEAICKGDPARQEQALRHHMSETIQAFEHEISAKTIKLLAVKTRYETVRREYEALQAT